MARGRQKQEEQQEQQDQRSEAELVAIIAGALAVGASAQATANQLTKVLGIPVAILLPALLIALSKPIKYGIPTIPSSTASGESSNLEATYRAQYVLAASRRLQAASRLGKFEEALRAERRYFNQHLEAVQNRRNSASAVDRAVIRYGDELGWYAKMDSRTSAECRAANGKNFYASKMPPIGYPGAVHPHCRCTAGRKHATSQTVYTVKFPDLKRTA